MNPFCRSDLKRIRSEPVTDHIRSYDGAKMVLFSRSGSLPTGEGGGRGRW